MTKPSELFHFFVPINSRAISIDRFKFLAGQISRFVKMWKVPMRQSVGQSSIQLSLNAILKDIDAMIKHSNTSPNHRKFPRNLITAPIFCNNIHPSLSTGQWGT
jgi:hypothetical protein